MLIACPACSTRYVVPDSAVGVEGRTVRCAKCRHSWFQHGPELPARPEPVVAEAVQIAHPPASRSSPVAAPSPPLSSQGVATARVTPSPSSSVEQFDDLADAPVPEPPVVPRQAMRGGRHAFDDSGSRFDHEPPFRPRRNKAKLWTIAAACFASLVAVLIVLGTWFGLPRWLPTASSTFGAGRPDLVLSFPPERQDRRTLPNGTEYFGASGTVTNVGKEPQDVPPILIVLRDGSNKVVYTWDVTPPRESLKPGEAVTINEAVTDVPKSAKVAEIGWKPD